MATKKTSAGSGGAMGFDLNKLSKVEQRVKKDIEQSKYDGARILVARRGEKVLDLTIGYAERETKRAMQPDAVFSVMSISKVMTAIALLQCVERGDLSLLTPVAQIIPEFAKRGKDKVTVGQILTHTAGLGMAPVALPADEIGVLAKSVAAICELPLESTPGELVSYSAMTGFTILAEIVRRLDAKKRHFRKIMADDVLDPLGMKDASFGLPDRLRKRRVPVIVRDDDAPELNRKFLAARDQVVSAETELASGGATFATADDILKLGEALRLGGALNGNRVLSPATVKLMTTNQTGLKPNGMMNSSRALHSMAPFPAFLGLGLFLRGEGLFPSHIASLASPG
ncbi:MAG: beta-lactamase family protein, partial [Akkermansiaceae bacterium]|nr:beta-lactamase family protein [Akkermansiaceae bacterium]